ncbi:MAG: pilus assembly PilX N-terminal domain-containing protein [Candidatus Peregrinibacteria bacterium]|nr:pilus assembly PilX N-terminal domain-containing protein [Candidatus Peregrinibacteria bacterium]
MKAKLLKNRKGTALIVALLVMGVLMAISLALSTLVLRESIVTREFLDAGQSFYAAESASEIGLYGVKNSLPGWEPKGGVVPIIIDGAKDKIEASKAVAELKISNKCKAYPCFDKDYDVEGKLSTAPDISAFYATLGLNESATIPLFVLGDGGMPTPITDFDVEFYANFNPKDIKITQKGSSVSDWDVLRWKIVGLNDSIKGKAPVTESISDFTAVTSTLDGTFTSASQPSWFGTKPCEGSGRYTDLIKCQLYQVYSESLNCTQTEAREFYLYSFIEGERSNEVKHCWPLSRFINDHKLNYLTLTNLINPSIFNDPKLSDQQSKINYRVELFTDGKATEAVRDYADITADGYSGKSKQSVNVKIKRDSFMPVFNFSLYSTYMDTKGEHTGADGGAGDAHGEKYWYGGKDK